MDELVTASLREKTFALETEMRRMPNQIQIEVIHHFSPGVYAREIHIPADTTLVGEIHKYPQLNILSQGEISVSTDDGIKRISAPFTIVSPAGTKRVAYAHTDCVWTTILHTEETDIDKIWNHFIAKDEDDWLAFSNADQLKLDLK